MFGYLQSKWCNFHNTLVHYLRFWLHSSAPIFVRRPSFSQYTIPYLGWNIMNSTCRFRYKMTKVAFCRRFLPLSLKQATHKIFWKILISCQVIKNSEGKSCGDETMRGDLCLQVWNNYRLIQILFPFLQYRFTTNKWSKTVMVSKRNEIGLKCWHAERNTWNKN